MDLKTDRGPFELVEKDLVTGTYRRITQGDRTECTYEMGRIIVHESIQGTKIRLEDSKVVLGDNRREMEIFAI